MYVRSFGIVSDSSLRATNKSFLIQFETLNIKTVISLARVANAELLLS